MWKRRGRSHKRFQLNRLVIGVGCAAFALGVEGVNRKALSSLATPPTFLEN